MGVDRIGEGSDRASEGQAAGVMGPVLQWGLWQGMEPGVVQWIQGTRLDLTRI